MPASVVSELYTDPAQRQVAQVVPSEPVAPPPPGPAQPVKVTEPVPNRLFADQGSDGSVKDTSGAALEKGGLRSQKVDEIRETPKPVEEQAGPGVEASPTPDVKPIESAVPPAPKKWADKFDSPEDLEKAYRESQSAMTKAFQAKAEAERQLQVRQVTPPAPADPAKANQELLERFVADPKGVLEEMQGRTLNQIQSALAANQARAAWLQANLDIASHEQYVADEMARLVRSNPELAADPKTALEQATANWRAVVGSIRTQAQKEALTTETRVIPVLSNNSPAPVTEQPKPAPLTADQAYEATMQFLKREESRTHRGLGVR